MEEPILQKMYGLPDGNNPYAPKELNPMKDPSQLDLIVRTGPFAAIDEVDAYLKQCLEQGTTAFFLVTGESGTGRSSVARAIIAMYRKKLFSDHPNIEQDRFFTHEIQEKELHEDPYPIYKDWFANLRNAVYFKRSKLTLPNGFFTDLDAVFETLTQDNYNAKLQQLLGDVSELLRNQQEPAGFGLLVEKIPNHRYVLAAKQIFQYSRAICVFTVPGGSDEIRSVFASNFSNQLPHLIHLEGIRGEAIRMLLENRWNGAGTYPFVEEGIHKAFATPVPIGKALYIVSSMLEVRAIEKRNDPPWPGNSALCFKLEDFLLAIPFFSRSWR